MTRMRAPSSIAAALILALAQAPLTGTWLAPAYAHGAGQGTGFSMTPPIPGYSGGNAPAAGNSAPATSVPMTPPASSGSTAPGSSASSSAPAASDGLSAGAAGGQNFSIPSFPTPSAPSQGSTPFAMPSGQAAPAPAGRSPAPSSSSAWIPAPDAGEAPAQTQTGEAQPVNPQQAKPAPYAQAPAMPSPSAPAAPRSTPPASSAQAPASPPTSAAPPTWDLDQSSTGIELPGEPGAPAPTAAPFQMVPGQPAPVITQVPATSPAAEVHRRPDRFLIPQRRMIFAGEVASRAWVFYATQEEANRQASFLLSYLSAVVVMPETSRIRVTVNGQALIERPIAASQEPAHFEVPIQRGTLRPGANLIRIDVVQRHRTDCAVTATYELWTEINNEGTGLVFNGGRPPLSGGLDDLASVGFDQYGVTPIRIVTPGPIEGGGSARVLRVVQGLAVRGQFPNPAVTVAEGQIGQTPPGGLTVVVGTASELPRLMASVPNEARLRPITTLLEDDRLGAPTLVISGPTAADVDRAIDRLNAISIPRTDAVNTQTLYAPNAPLFDSSRSVRLGELGVPTQEFSGRRFRAEFQIALPADFYAQAYGNAQLLLDAAFTAAVRPGSHVDVYVNEQIASNLPITASGGGLFQRERMQIPLRNFRPGVNRLWLEVVLDTESDARCLPGATLPAENRFVLFDSTEFSIGNFARIGRLPDLASFSADAFPYNLDGNPVAVVLARQDSSTLSAAGTLMSRLALANGAPLPIDASPASVTLGERNVIFVGSIDQVSSSVLDQVGVAETVRTNWVVSASGDESGDVGSSQEYDNVLERFRSRQVGDSPPPPGEPRLDQNTHEVYERWRGSVQGHSSLYTIVEGFESWLERTFSINFESFRLQEGRRSLFEPPPRTSVLMAQGTGPTGSAAWTLVAGRTPEALAASMTRFTSDAVWNRIGGQAVAYQVASGDIERRDIRSFSFIVTQPLSLGNLRMIAANWLSINILPYALMLVLAGTILGCATALLLRRLGRPS